MVVPYDEEINLTLHLFIDTMKECRGGGKADIFIKSCLHGTEALIKQS
jgi:hypothetical protein